MNTEHGKLYKLRFYAENRAFINIDPEFIQKLGLTESDDIRQELTDDGRIAIGRKVK
jgi:hypothetical protein